MIRKFFKMWDNVLEDQNEESMSEEDETSEDEMENSDLSPYERLIMKNKKEQQKFLQEIQLFDAKKKFVKSIDKVKPKPVKRVYKNRVPVSSKPVRKSRRLAKLDVDYSEDALIKTAYDRSREEEKKVIPPVLPFKEAMDNEELFDSFSKELVSHFKDSNLDSNDMQYTKSVFKNMKLREDCIAKVVPTRITVLDIHPYPETVIVCAGSKYGHIGFWNVLSDANPFVLQPHSEGVTGLHFNPLDSNILISSSYDGTMRCCDMIKKVFEKVYDVSEETSCSGFDFLSSVTFIVGQRNGKVSVVDTRTKGKTCEKKHLCHDYPVKTVSVHPVEKTYFISADNKGAIRLWDLRKLQAHPVADIRHHKRSLNSAFFSPVTGRSILSTSLDDSLAIFDSKVLSEDIKLKAKVHHNNWTGRWLTTFRATWIPTSDEQFVIGSMLHPRRIEVFNDNLNNIYNFVADDLTSIPSVNVFHPSRSVLAGGNSSGKVFVLQD